MKTFCTVYFCLASVFVSCQPMNPVNELPEKEKPKVVSAPQQKQTKFKLRPRVAFRWVKRYDAPFDKSYNFQLFTQENWLYAFHPKGTWKTTDGKTWVKTALPYITNLAFMEYVQFKGAVYALGAFEGNIEQYHISTAIRRTTDFEHWETVAKTSNLPKRFFRKIVVFQDKLWLLSSTDGDGTNGYNDIWYSEDAVHWTKAPRPASWSPRMGSEVLIFHDVLYLIGGGDAKGTKTDVWRSHNGFDWEQVTPEMHPNTFWGYAGVVFEDKIWLLGCNRNGAFTNEVMVSEDAQTWLPTHADWSPRGGVAAAVFQDKLFVTGGKFSKEVSGETQFAYYNDVWTMEKEVE